MNQKNFFVSAVLLKILNITSRLLKEILMVKLIIFNFYNIIADLTIPFYNVNTPKIH